jgi:excisionase family DNA binding protein
MNTNSITTPANDLARTAYTTPEAAAYLGLAVSTLNKWRCYGSGPKFLKLGRSVRYRRSELDQFVETRMLDTTLGY